MSRILWLDLGDLGAFVFPSGPLERWQDHGLGLLRTIMHQQQVYTDLFSLRSIRDWSELPSKLYKYDMLLMNVRSYTFPLARTAARLFKEVNPAGLVIVGGMHATVAGSELIDEPAFDHVCVGPGEALILKLVSEPSSFPRIVPGRGLERMDDWPLINRRLWPNPGLADFPWPLEPSAGWGPSPVATMITSKVCPWRCSFCNESTYIEHAHRRSVQSVIDELEFLNNRFGPLGSVVLHDSMFFQNPHWLEQWLVEYPRKTAAWPYWAAARADTVRRWPELFEALVRKSNWHTVSIGFESGSDRMLKVLNKECSLEDNLFAITLLNRIGDDFVSHGKLPPMIWSNIMLGIPGESRDDAFATMALLKLMKYSIPSISYYAPYPGSSLGHQLIAEKKSLMGRDRYHRNPSDRKLVGVDYKFYAELRAGRFVREVDQHVARLKKLCSGLEATTATPVSSEFYLFSLPNGGRKLSHGKDEQEALRTLMLRLPDSELTEIDPCPIKIKQKDLPRYYEHLA